ncbi:MAG: helix-turn-helix domain-containing protein [Chthoniobacterales bacterium]
MEKVENKISLAKKKTVSEKLRTKSEILAVLDEMEFRGDELVAAAQGIADVVSGRKKTTLRTFQHAANPEMKPEEISFIRSELNMSQAVFASFLGVRPASVMSWEYGTRQPSGAVRKLLSIARKNPKILIEA